MCQNIHPKWYNFELRKRKSLLVFVSLDSRASKSRALVQILQSLDI